MRERVFWENLLTPWPPCRRVEEQAAGKRDMKALLFLLSSAMPFNWNNAMNVDKDIQ